MQSGSAHPASPPDAVHVQGRPDYLDSYVQGNLRTPATAERTPVTPPHERRTTRPKTLHLYLPEPSPEMTYFGRCFAYAYITTPAGAPCQSDRAPLIRAAIGGVLPGLKFELTDPDHGADKTVRFATPEDREAAMERQPFELDDGATVVKLVREGETGNVRHVRLETLAHLALHGYPKELRGVEEVRSRCCGFGHLLEIDPACFDAPDLSPVRVVVRMERAAEIPRQVRIMWMAGVFRHVVPVQILRVWDWAEAVDANGEYVPIYGAAGVVRT